MRADGGYSRRENFGSSLVHSMFLMYSLAGLTSMVQEVESLRGYGRCMFLGGTFYSHVQTLFIIIIIII